MRSNRPTGRFVRFVLTSPPAARRGERHRETLYGLAMALAGGRLTTLDRRIIALAIPALGALIVEALYTISDTAIVGRLGRAQLGGLALATTVLNLVGWT